MKQKVCNVISLELSSSPLASRIISPRIVRAIDWVQLYWPRDLMGLGVYPQVIRYCLMSPAKSWTDWHVDFSASSVFYHVLRGSKVFYFIRPTRENLRAYELWSGSEELQAGTWLGDRCDKVYKVGLIHYLRSLFPLSRWISCWISSTREKE